MNVLRPCTCRGNDRWLWKKRILSSKDSFPTPLPHKKCMYLLDWRQVWQHDSLFLRIGDNASPHLELGSRHVTCFTQQEAGKLNAIKTVKPSLPSYTSVIIMRRTPTLPEAAATLSVWDPAWTHMEQPRWGTTPRWICTLKHSLPGAQPRRVNHQATHWQVSKNKWLWTKNANYRISKQRML